MLKNFEVTPEKNKRFPFLGIAKTCVLVALLILVSLDIASAQENTAIKLSPYIDLHEISPISKDIHEELDNRKTIVFGVSAEGLEPYEIIQGKILKGITADYLSILEKKLGIQIQVLAYPNRMSTLNALRNGEVDIISGTETKGGRENGIISSTPYALNTPVIVGRGAKLEFSKVKPEGEITFVEKYTPKDQIERSLPGITLTSYSSVLSALHDVEYHKKPWFIGDPAAISFYIGKGELTQLHTYPLNNGSSTSYSFSLRSEEHRLVDLINNVISRISAPRKAQITDYWSTNPNLRKLSNTEYNHEEQAWLLSHPNVKVAINGALPPYSFYDDSGDIKGVVIDLLAEISQNTGINFTLVDYISLSGLEQSLRNKDTDMAMTLLPNSDRKAYLKFTEPYLNNSFALVTRVQNQVNSLEVLKGKKVAIQRSNFVEDRLTKHHPSVQIIKKDSQLDSLIAIVNGEADAAVTLLPTATFLIRQYFAEDLKVSTSLPDFQANLPFAIRSDEPLLYSVMLKSINQLKPGYIASLMSNWKGTPPTKKSVWKAYISSYKVLGVAALVILLLVLCAISYIVLKRTRALREAERFEVRSALLDSIPMAISVRDLDGRFVFCNQIFYSQLKTAPEAVIGKLTSEFIGLPPDQAKQQEHLYFRVLQSGVADQRQLDATVNGIPITLRQWDRPFTDKNGTIAGLISGYADVTANVLLLQQLRDAHDSAVQANDAKSRFLAIMSHEIRTPLNAIIGLLELTIQRIGLGGSCNPDDLEVAFESSKSLIELIDDVLDLAKIESGKTNLIAQRCNLSDVTQSVVRIFSAVAQQKNIYLRLNNMCAQAPDVLVDAGRFKQVLSNLLSNAIKFTDSGGVTVNLGYTKVSQGVLLNLEVIDTGIGISESDQIDLFKPFSQVHTAHQSRGGTGLGLVICRQLVEMMGGTLELSSTINKGTRIRIEICVPELEPSLAVTLPATETANINKLNFDVLLVDDHPANRLLLGQQLQFLGHTVQEAEDGKQALELLQQQKFDLIITDCIMPVMDGYQLSREWRKHETQLKLDPIWILGFTANVQPEEHLKCLDAGMDGCLFKPVSLAELETCIGGLRRPAAEKLVTNIPVNKEAQLLDHSAIDGITGGNKKLGQMLIAQLHTSNAMDLQHLGHKIQEKQWAELAALAHRLKGVARLINSTALIAATTSYEVAFSERHEETALTQLSKNIKTTLEDLQAELFKNIQSISQSTTKN